MKKDIYNKIAAAVIVASTFAGMVALPVSAQILGLSATASSSAGGGSLSVTAQANLTRGKNRADQEIDRRTNSLNALDVRVKAMVKLSDTEKTSLDATIQTQLSDMASLKVKIDGDTDLATLRTDIQSITKAYRIFALVIPQGAILAASDRVETMVSSASTLAGKLQTRISEEQSAGNDMSTSVAALADFNAKVLDADSQGQAAVTEVSSLTPDNGDQTQLAANTAALKDARSKIQTAQKDLIAARKDAGTIVKALISLDRGLNASSSASVSSTVGQ